MARLLKIFVFAMICAAFPALGAGAAVIGNSGAVYAIKEKDLLEVIHEQVGKVDHTLLREKIQADFKRQLAGFRLKDAVSGLPPTARDKVYRVDLSFTVSPELARALTDAYGREIYPAGTKVNPLKLMNDQGLAYPFLLVALNGERQAELDWFMKQGFNDNMQVKLLISDGAPMALAEKLKRPVFQLTRRIMERFKIESTPTILFWPRKSDFISARAVHVPDGAEPQKITGE